MYEAAKTGLDYIDPVTLSEEEMIALARKTLSDLGISLEGFELSGFSNLTNTGSSDITVLLESGVEFHKTTDGYKNVGNSRIAVAICCEGVCGLTFMYNDTEPALKIKSRSLDDVKENLLDDIIYMSFGDQFVSARVLTEINITEVEIVYQDVAADWTEQPHIQPCYKMTGTATSQDGVTADILIYVSAVPDEYYKADLEDVKVG